MASALLACNVGDSGDGDGDGIDPGPGPEPGPRQVSLACEAELSITGTLEPPGTPPTEEDGCVPEGTWTLEVSLADPGDCDPDVIEFNEVYEYSVTIDGLDEIMEYLGDDGNPDEDTYNPARSGSTCRANLTHYSPDGLKVVMLQPFEEDLDITGSGVFELWAVDDGS